ncbi:MAG: BTAD domain-containing putative transcriptional regulator, partial [Anaerolineae bacterium]
MLRIWVFAAPRIAFEGDAADTALPADSLRLLTYLLVHRRRPVSRRRMASTLWPDAPEDRALANLRRQLHRLQQILAAGETGEFIAADRLTIQWNPTPPYWLDMEEFEGLCVGVGDSRSAEDTERRSDLEEAIALYRGDLGGDMHDPWILAERERLGTMYRDALDHLLGLHVAAADLRAASEVAQRLLDTDPLREEAHRIVIGLHYLAGDRGQALAAFRRCRDLLEAEFSVEPMGQTIDLVEAVRALTGFVGEPV